MDAVYIVPFLATAVGASNITSSPQLDAVENREPVKLRGVRNCDSYSLIISKKGAYFKELFYGIGSR